MATAMRPRSVARLAGPAPGVAAVGGGSLAAGPIAAMDRRRRRADVGAATDATAIAAASSPSVVFTFIIFIFINTLPLGSS